MINLNQRLGVFTVIGTTGTPHAIKLFPKESCTCPSTSRCYHILAVRMTIGLEDVNSRKKVNLTQLRRNVRSRNEKKSGRKRPRPNDYEVQAAPDANTLVGCIVWDIYHLENTYCFPCRLAMMKSSCLQRRSPVDVI